MSRLNQLLRKTRRNGTNGHAAGGHAPSVASYAGTWFEAQRPRHPAVGLARDLLNDPAQSAALDEPRRALLAQPGTLELIRRDDVPIPATDDREGYSNNQHLDYWLSGLEDFRLVESMVPREALANVLDFGGATGRFARHVLLAHAAAKVTIADLSLNHVLWCTEHFGPALRAVKVGATPHFPLADRSISLCVGLSVFTHIDSFETGWLAEINRALVDGGHAFLTIHSEHTWPLLHTRQWPLEAMRQDPKFTAQYLQGQPMPGERLVYDYQPGTIYHCCNTFLHTDYVRRSWGRWFDIVEIRPLAHFGFQTVVLLRKRS
jgi:SAM-dependent methyltransferase